MTLHAWIFFRKGRQTQNYIKCLATSFLKKCGVGCLFSAQNKKELTQGITSCSTTRHHLIDSDRVIKYTCFNSLVPCILDPLFDKTVLFQDFAIAFLESWSISGAKASTVLIHIALHSLQLFGRQKQVVCKWCQVQLNEHKFNGNTVREPTCSQVQEDGSLHYFLPAALVPLQSFLASLLFWKAYESHEQSATALQANQEFVLLVLCNAHLDWFFQARNQLCIQGATSNTLQWKLFKHLRWQIYQG